MKRSLWIAGLLALAVLTGTFTFIARNLVMGLNTARAFAESPENKTTAGVDRDHNGIRDEVDALISKEYRESPTQTKAAQNLAKNLQITVRTDDIGKIEAVKLANQGSDAIDCLMSNISEEKAYLQATRLIDLTFNTPERQRNDRHFSALVSGQKFIAKGIKGCK